MKGYVITDMKDGLKAMVLLTIALAAFLFCWSFLRGEADLGLTIIIAGLIIALVRALASLYNAWETKKLIREMRRTS